MLEEPTVVYTEPESDSTTHLVHALRQFLLTARYRKNVVFAAMLVAALFGGLYYFTATPYYESTASILITGSGLDGTSISGPPDRGRQRNAMPTFQSLFTKTKVLAKAIPLLQPEDRIDFGEAPVESWPAILEGNLSTEVLRGTNIIEITYRSKDPKVAVAAVNAVIESYQMFLDETHQGTAKDVSRLFINEKVATAEKLAVKERELQQARYRIFDLGVSSDSKELHPKVQSVIFFQKAVDEAEKERMDLEASLATIQSAIRNGESLQQQVLALADTAGMELLMTKLGINKLNAYFLAEIEQGLLKNRTELKTMLAVNGPAHPEVIEKTDNIRETERYLLQYQQDANHRVDQIQRAELGPMLTHMVQQKLYEAWQKEQTLRARLQRAQAEAMQINGQLSIIETIKHQVEWLREEHDTLLKKIAGFEFIQDGPEVRTAVVQDAVEADNPVSPNLRRVIMMVLVGGLAMGLALVYVQDILDDRFRSIEEIQQQLGVPVLAMVRQLKTSHSDGLDAVAMHVEPGSVQCEAIRTLRTALELADQEARQIVISSAEPGDGKTTVLANLAVSFAQYGKRTLVIDADLRRPGMTALMGMRGRDGVSGIIRGQAPVPEMAAKFVRPSGVEGLDAMPCGPRPANPAELLANTRFSELLAWAETVYDQILIDSPPTLATSDTAVIGRLVDGVVIVVQPSKNRRRMVSRAKQSLVSLKIPLLGVVVNRIGSDDDRAYYGYDGGYGYSQEYGPDDDHRDAPAEDQETPLGEALRNRFGRENIDPPAIKVPKRIA